MSETLQRSPASCAGRTALEKLPSFLRLWSPVFERLHPHAGGPMHLEPRGHQNARDIGHFAAASGETIPVVTSPLAAIPLSEIR
jgi:hypothetical protein